MSSPSDATGPVGERTAVIHDLGYRPYAGPRLTDRQVAWSLYVTGLRNAYGLGRSARSKILPMILLGVMMLTAFILVAVLVQAKKVLDLKDQIVAYSSFSSTMLVVVTVFVAAQAPALISRDLRFRTLTLYLARPLSRSTYALVRLASLVSAIWLFLTLPLLLLYVGGLLADLPFGDQSRQFGIAVAGTAVLALVLGSLAALVSAWTPRRGLAVAAVIMLLLVTYVVSQTVTGVATETAHMGVAAVGTLLSPYALVDGLMVSVAHITPPGPTQVPPHPGAALGLVRIAAVVLVVTGCLGGLLMTYRRAANK